MKEKVVVTGGAGFLGSHLSAALLLEGYEVHVVDNLVASKKENVPDGATLHQFDVRDMPALEGLFAELDDVACVFHLAALPRVQFSIDNPEEAHDVNVNGTFNVLLASKNAKVKRVLYSASSAAYGDQATLPLREDMTPNPMSPYALHKYLGEEYCRVFSIVYGLPTVSMRYFNLYGPGADPNGPYAQAIIKFIDQRAHGQPMTIVGDGEQTRDSVHVRDVVRANILAMKSEKVGKGEMMNIGSGKDYSVNAVAKMIGGPTVGIEPRIEPRHTRADITRAKELLGWEPTISLEEGIAELKQIHGLQ
jgi:nucleoside-diphosphate-sugar epimerase